MKLAAITAFLLAVLVTGCGEAGDAPPNGQQTRVGVTA
jgi:hypothetical protein